MLLLFIICLLTIITLLIKHENFEESIKKESIKEESIKPGRVKEETKYNPSNQQISDIYEETKKFENNPPRLGIDLCYEQCKGNCVEYGITGFAFCFE